MAAVSDTVTAINRAVSIEKKPVSALGVLNETFCYDKPSSFSRGLRLPKANSAIFTPPTAIRAR